MASSVGGILVFLVMAAATGRESDGPLLVVLGGLVGVAASPRSAAARTLLDEAVPARLHVQALRVNATLTEVMVLVAFLLVGAAALASPPAVPLAMALLLASGAALTIGLPRRGAPPEPRAKAERHTLTPFLRSRAFWLWCAVEAAFGQVLGTVEPAALPWARQIGLGTFAAAGALAGLSVAGIAASPVYLRMRPGRLMPQTEALGMVGLLVVGALGFAVSGRWLEGAAALAVCGVATVPLNALTAHAAAASMPDGRRTEGFAILGSACSAGYALGSAALTILPLEGTLLCDATLGLVVLALTPLWQAADRDRVGALTTSAGTPQT